MRLQCPKCEANVHVAVAPEDGAKVKCPKCQVRFLPPEEEDEDRDEDEAPRRAAKGKKKGKKKTKSAFPVVPVAIVSVGAVAIAVVAIVLMTGGEKKKKADDTAAVAPSTSTPALATPVAGPSQIGSGDRPKEMPPEAAAIFATKDDHNLFAPPSSVAANLIVPQKGTHLLTVNMPLPPPAAKDAGKLTREEVEKASVYIKCLAGNQGGTGSGFLIRAQNGEGLVATNFHVIEFAVLSEFASRAVVSVIFDSGLKTEVEYPAEIVAAEPEVDLAVLRIKNAKNLPKPLEPRFMQAPKTTQEILIYGFPLGQILATGGRSPAITIGKGTISSLRRGEDGEIERLQIDGNVNPGNSGGPVVDTDGRLVGITVAKIRDDLGQGIGFAVPAEQLVAAMEGRVVYPGFLPPVIRNNEAIFHAMIPVSDPLNQMKSASLLVWSGSGRPPATAKGKPLSGAVDVKISTAVKGLASADVRFPTAQGNLAVALQTCIVTNSGETIYSTPVNYQLRVETRSGGSTDLPLSTFAANPHRFQGNIVAVRGIMTGPPTAVWDKCALALTDEAGRALPAHWLFLANADFVAPLKEVNIPAGKGMPVRLVMRIGTSRSDLGPVMRVLRVDFMDGVKVNKTVPAVSGTSDGGQNALASLNQSPKSFVGRDVTIETRMSTNVRGTAQEPQYTIFLSTGAPAANIYFTSSKELADKFRAVDLPTGSVDRVRATLRVDDERKINNLPVATIAKFELLGRNGEVLKTLE